MADNQTAMLAARVRQVVAGNVKTLAVCGPPRSGKTSTVITEGLSGSALFRLGEGEDFGVGQYRYKPQHRPVDARRQLG